MGLYNLQNAAHSSFEPPCAQRDIFAIVGGIWLQNGNNFSTLTVESVERL